MHSGQLAIGLRAQWRPHVHSYTCHPWAFKISADEFVRQLRATDSPTNSGWLLRVFSGGVASVVLVVARLLRSLLRAITACAKAFRLCGCVVVAVDCCATSSILLRVARVVLHTPATRNTAGRFWSLPITILPPSRPFLVPDELLTCSRRARRRYRNYSGHLL